MESLITSIKFAAARTVLLERLQRALSTAPMEVEPESVNGSAAETGDTIADDAPTPADLDDESGPITPARQENAQAQSHENMEIEHPDDPEPLFITLDQELGVQLRVRPPCRRATITPPVDSLARSFSSVLVSPFVDKSDEEGEGDAVEMRTIDEQLEEQVIKADHVTEEQNPFLAT